MTIYLRYKIFLFFVLCLFPLFSIVTKPAFAASTVMGFLPSTGSYSQPFTVNLVIDGHGDTFNAAQATITPSSNLVVKDVMLGDCNFSFLITPGITNLSFE